MGHSSQSGQIIVRSQPDAGVFAPDLETDGIAVRLRSGALAGNRDLLVLDPEIGGGRDTADAYLGAVNFQGDYEMYPRYDSITTFLRGILGESASAAHDTEVGAFVHTITPTDDQPPFLSIYERIAFDLDRYRYTDVMVNSLSIEADSNGFLTATASMLGRLMVAGGTDITGPEFDLSPATVGTNIFLTYAGEMVPAKSFSLEINQNIEDDDYRLGSLFMGDMTAKQREVSGSMALRHENNLALRQALFGTPGATQVGGLTTKEELVIHIESYEIIEDTMLPYSLDVSLGKVAFEPFAFEPSGDDVLENDVAFRALRPNPADPIMTAVVTNGRETIA